MIERVLVVTEWEGVFLSLMALAENDEIKQNRMAEPRNEEWRVRGVE